MGNLLTLLKKIRTVYNRNIFPVSRYWVAVKTTKPISTKFGYDRGQPIDRYWIEKFLHQNAEFITGACLEITDDFYTSKFGGNKVTKSDVLDIDPKNHKANIHGNLKNLKPVVADNTYDCVILTHVLGLIDDIDSAISECHRILKPGGTLLVTSACISPTYDLTSNHWRFTPNGAKYLFSKTFKPKLLTVTSYGNVLTGQCFWAGMSQEDLTTEQLEYNDPKYPCIVTLKAIKDKD